MKKLDLVCRPELFCNCVAPFTRMSMNLLEFYHTGVYTEDQFVRARCTAGVSIEMTTNAVEMQIDMTIGKRAREIFTFDVDIDGKLSTYDGRESNYITLEPGKKSVKIYLPNMATLDTFDLQLNDDAEVAPRLDNSKKKIILCGDSIMQGMTSSSPARSLGVLLGRMVNMDVHNTSVGGARMFSKAVEESIALGGDAIIVGFGCNDAAQQISQDFFRNETRAALELLKNFPGKSFIVTPIPSCNYVEPRREPYCRIIREEYSKLNGTPTTLLEGESFFPADEKLMIDQLHPNDAGMIVYAEALADAVKKALV